MKRVLRDISLIIESPAPASTYLTFIIGCAVSVAAFYLMHSWEQDRALHRFEHEAGQHVTILQQNLAVMINSVQSVKGLFTASNKVERDEFRKFVTPMFGYHQGIQALEWIPRVKASERAAFEAAARREGYPEFTFTERAGDGRLVPAADRETYFPVYFLAPHQGNETALGFDLASEPTHLKFLQLARDTGEIQATARITPVREAAEQYGFLIIQPIYRNDAPTGTPEERRESLLGFVLGVFRIGDIVEMTPLSSDGAIPDMEILVFDQSAPAGGQLLYPKSARFQSRADIRSPFCMDTANRVASREWLVTLCLAGDGDLGVINWQTWMILAAGLLITGLLTGYQQMSVIQRARIEKHSAELRQKIVERRRAEEKLEKALFEQSVIFDNASMGIAFLKDRKFVRVNMKFEDMFGYAADELKGESTARLHPSREAYEEFGKIAYPILAEDETYSMERLMKRKDGSLFWVLLSGKMVEMAEVSGDSIWIFEDITERKAMEEQLRQSLKMEAIGQLTGGVAHDFNNLLAIILGNLELLEERIGDEGKLRELARRAIGAAERGAALTQRLLAFSRKQALQPEVINLDRLMQGMTDLLRRTLGETIKIETVSSDGLWKCEADPAQLENVLLNLAVNARDAMPKGGRLTIETRNAHLDDDYASAHPDLASGDYVQLTVSDTGSGIAPETLKRVFEPFFTTKEVGKGSGLGLSMVYGFVKQSGGHVTIYSEEDEGTTVKIYLPRIKEETETREDKAADREVPSARGETVLVVEDDPEVLTLAVTLLGDLGYEVLEAGDGEAGLAVLEENPRVGLLLTDLVLPGGIGGRDLSKEVRRRSPDVKVLFMSGYTEESAVHQGRLGEGVRLLTKPFRKADLARMVRDALDGEYV